MSRYNVIIHNASLVHRVNRVLPIDKAALSPAALPPITTASYDWVFAADLASDMVMAEVRAVGNQSQQMLLLLSDSTS